MRGRPARSRHPHRHQADRERVARLRDYAVELTTYPRVLMTVEAPAAGATMGRLYAYQDKLPQIAASALLLDSAEITGDVVEPAAIICDYSRVGAGSLVRAGACVKQRDRFPALSVLDGFPTAVVDTLQEPPERPSWAPTRQALQTLVRL